MVYDKDLRAVLIELARGDPTVAAHMRIAEHREVDIKALAAEIIIALAQEKRRLLDELIQATMRRPPPTTVVGSAPPGIRTAAEAEALADRVRKVFDL